jgi:hypothetical protein
MRKFLNCIMGIAVMSSGCLVLSYIAVANPVADVTSPITDAAKTIGGMGPTEIMALVTLASIAALVAVVKIFVGRFLKGLDGLVNELKSRPCMYLPKKHTRGDDDES